eukprot:m.32272 g.32272  ORF g.32272 m.32272 type:complete len:228 (-) comp4975_c0_seq2:191-874(-)
MDDFSSLFDLDPNLGFALAPDMLMDSDDAALSLLSEPLDPSLPWAGPVSLVRQDSYSDFDFGQLSRATPTSAPSTDNTMSPASSPLSADSPASNNAVAVPQRLTAPSPRASLSSAARTVPTAPSLHPSSARGAIRANDSSARMAMSSGMRGCPKRKRKTIQRKRQEQVQRIEQLTTSQRDLKELVRVAAEEVRNARRTLYNVLKTARQGQLNIDLPLPSDPMASVVE